MYCIPTDWRQARRALLCSTTVAALTLAVLTPPRTFYVCMGMRMGRLASHDCCPAGTHDADARPTLRPACCCDRFFTHGLATPAPDTGAKPSVSKPAAIAVVPFLAPMETAPNLTHVQWAFATKGPPLEPGRPLYLRTSTLLL